MRIFVHLSAPPHCTVPASRTNVKACMHDAMTPETKPPNQRFHALGLPTIPSLLSQLY